jgi:hypothetical protein
MEQSLRAVQTACRVLTAMRNQKRPDPEDVEELRRLDPLMADMPLNSLAIEVIRLALKRVVALRARGRVATDAPSAAVRLGQAAK